jgi:hypothetical protein
MISSTESTSLNSAYGFFDACWRAFAEIFANVSFFVPYFQRYSRPAPPNICAAGGAELKPCSSFITLTNLSSGFARSFHLAESAPASICSKPTTSTHSAMPPATACAPSISAELPVEQLLLTLNTGMPVRPSW